MFCVIKSTREVDDAAGAVTPHTHMVSVGDIASLSVGDKRDAYQDQ